MSQKAASSADAAKPPQNVLVFGGNGLMGSATVTALRRYAPDANIFIVNRGNWYWDTSEIVKPYVTHVRCDRQSLVDCAAMRKHENVLFDLVVDFSGYRPSFIRSATQLLKGRVGLYVYMSTDSVYEVSIDKTHDGLSVETDAIRPEAAEERRRLNEADSYGHEKFQGEEELAAQVNKYGGFPYVVLRLPDVIGPRDNTGRFWPYQMWIKYQQFLETPITLPSDIAGQPMSLVFSEDVARAVIDSWQAGKKVHNQAINLGFDEDTSLMNFLQRIQRHLGVKDGDASYELVPSCVHLFPSVTRGPVDISKAKNLIGWQPTSLDDAISKTVQFYNAAETRFASERDDVFEDLSRWVIRDKGRRKRAMATFVQLFEEPQTGKRDSEPADGSSGGTKRQKTEEL
ncbi:PREDICTED: uncharacterized protein LOC106814077 isoform X2 [Priapulus caudatus]|nr:PREDICTED: uncharacterized protein LOC106814077 isoform X2 [Priapulus caudatus]XP_014673839.1 PREDICTED: uncharacterized protein LOC106814077 isoform X2 [Priapulus caudatus]